MHSGLVAFFFRELRRNPGLMVPQGTPVGSAFPGKIVVLDHVSALASAKLCGDFKLGRCTLWADASQVSQPAGDFGAAIVYLTNPTVWVDRLFHLPATQPPATIVEVELFAISQALSVGLEKVRRGNPVSEVVVLSDCQGGMDQLERTKDVDACSAAVKDIIVKATELVQVGVDVCLQWVPAHIRPIEKAVSGNELADRLAKLAAIASPPAGSVLVKDPEGRDVHMYSLCGKGPEWWRPDTFLAQKCNAVLSRPPHTTSSAQP